MFCILTSCTFIKTSKGFHLVVIHNQIDLIIGSVHHVHQIFVNCRKNYVGTHTLNRGLSFTSHNKQTTNIQFIGIHIKLLNGENTL